VIYARLAAALALIALVAFGYARITYLKGELAAARHALAELKTEVESLGREAKIRNDGLMKAHKAAVEVADAKHLRDLALLSAELNRLRDEGDRARGSFVPPAASGAGRADLACFDRPQLELAIRGLVADVRGLVDEGSQAVVELNIAKVWAAGRN